MHKCVKRERERERSFLVVRVKHDVLYIYQLACLGQTTWKSDMVLSIEAGEA